MTRALTSALSTAIVQPELRTALLFEGQFGGQTLRLWNGTCDLIQYGPENLIPWSEDLSQSSWDKTTQPVTLVGTNTIKATTAALRHTVYNNLFYAATVGIQYEYTLDVSYVNYQYAIFGESGDSAWHNVVIDLVNGTLGYQRNCTATIETISAGRYRVKIVFSFVSGGWLRPYAGFTLGMADGSPASFAGAGTETMVVNSVQVRRVATSSGDYLLTLSTRTLATTTTWLGNGWLYIPEPPDEGDDMAAAQMTIVLAGVPQEVVSLALQPSGTAAMQQNSTGTLYFAALDANGALIADPYNLFTGKLDVPSIDERVGGSLVTLTYESAFVELDRAKEYRFNQETQKIFYPTDRGFEYVNAAKNWDGFWGTTKKEIAKKAAVNKGGSVKSNRATGNKGTRKK